jgi:DNA-binding NarL/FixJ family response regulator
VTSVLLADDQVAFRAGVRMALERHGWTVSAEADRADAAVEAALRERPDIALLEVLLPGGGVAAAERIAQALPATLIVMLTSSAEPENFLSAMHSGASGYLLKDIDPARLPAALEAVLRGEAAVPRGLAMHLVDDVRRRRGHRRAALTNRPGVQLREREWEVLDLLAEGRNTQEIAALMEIAPATVRSHVSRILSALGVKTRAAAIELLHSR